ncbi:hypothetical protein POVCU1_000290 [Plasmodium ovale curtisi]|uniref:Uncharacterized protein n=1 Tax=Plasmodium ovale curtisi TaxID=864141 RepID=A0A1A8VIN4_PLAOA|nr:hypothetical protein POVCU1_000290 [Plasmodium ovale curtisi]
MMIFECGGSAACFSFNMLRFGSTNRENYVTAKELNGVEILNHHPLRENAMRVIPFFFENSLFSLFLHHDDSIKETNSAVMSNYSRAQLNAKKYKKNKKKKKKKSV